MMNATTSEAAAPPSSPLVTGVMTPPLGFEKWRSSTTDSSNIAATSIAREPSWISTAPASKPPKPPDEPNGLPTGAEAAATGACATGGEGAANGDGGGGAAAAGGGKGAGAAGRGGGAEATGAG